MTTEIPTEALSLTEDMAAGIVSWTDDRRREFCATFADRSLASRWIMVRTAEIIAARAMVRGYLSSKHLRTLPLAETGYNYGYGYGARHDEPRFEMPIGLPSRYDAVAGRSVEDLTKIASERADAVLANLPPIRNAVKIIQPETAAMMARRDKILVDGQKLTDELTQIADPIKLADIDQNMTIGDFRALVKTRAAKRRVLVDKLNALGREGCELEATIAKALYAGLPGITEAVVKVIRDHLDRSAALDATCRRVHEQVMFGDSGAALALLRRFERDELTVEESIRAEFDAALDKLKVAGKAAGKAKAKIAGKAGK